MTRTPVSDLRLAPAALGCWCGAWWATGGSGGVGHVVVLGVVLVTVAGALVGATARMRLPSIPPALRSCLPGTALALGATGLLLVAASVQIDARDAAGLRAGAADGAVVTLVGEVASDPKAIASPWGGDPLVLVSLDVQAVDRGGRAVRAAAPVMVRGDDRWERLAVGTRVLVVGRLQQADPGEPELAEVAPTRPPQVLAGPHGPVGVADGLRSRFMEVTADLSPQARALVPGVAIGDDSRLAPDLDAAMKTTGLTHVTAVSGSHFAIVLASLTFACVAAGIRGRARIAVLAPAAAAFVLLVRAGPSVVRAAAMCAVWLLALALARPMKAVPALAVSVVVLLVCDPWLARSFGFGLSSAATAGIVLCTGPIALRLAVWVPRRLAFACAVPLAAQAACGPLLVLLSPTVGLYAVPANVLADPALVPATVLGVLATLVAPCSPMLAHAFAQAAGWATWWIAFVATTCARLPGAQVAWVPGRLGSVLLACATAALAIAAWNWRVAADYAGVRVPWEQGAGWRPAAGSWAARGRLRPCLPRRARARAGRRGRARRARPSRSTTSSSPR